MRRRRKRRRRARGGGLLDRIWRLVTSPIIIGLLLVAAGGVMVGGAAQTSGDLPSASWWVTALDAPLVFGTSASLLATALILLFGALIRRQEIMRRRPEDLPEPDVVLETARPDSASTWKRWLATLGAACLLGGGTLMLGFWFETQTGTPISEVSLLPGQTTEYYGVPLGDRSIKVMLPRRLELAALDPGERPEARVRFFELGSDEEGSTTLLPGESIDADGYRITFAGIETDPARPRAVFAGTGGDSIAVAAGVGESFKVRVGGTEYRVKDVVEDYQGALGPAAKVEADDLGEFWVFQRQPDRKRRPELLHDLHIQRIEASPAAIFKISKSRPFWPVTVAGTLFVFGLALLILFPERITRRVAGDDEDVAHAWSLTEAGRLRGGEEPS